MKLLANVVCIFALLAISSMVSAEIICPTEQSDVSFTIQFPSPTSCTEFYKCDRGVAILQHCPGGLQYNARSRVCDYPTSARCKI